MLSVAASAAISALANAPADVATAAANMNSGITAAAGKLLGSSKLETE